MNFTLRILNTSWIFDDDYDFDVPPPDPTSLLAPPPDPTSLLAPPPDPTSLLAPPPPPAVDTNTSHPTNNNNLTLWPDGEEMGGEGGGVDAAFVEAVVKSIVLAVMVMLTIGGNVLVLLAVLLTRHLRSSTHYLVVNLAVADLLLGTTVLPFSATLEVSGKWYFGQVFCEVWATADVLCCTASIWSLCVISLDRYIGVTRPLAYSSIMTERRMGVLIAAVWALSIVISIGPAFGWKTPPDPDPTVCTVNQELGYVLFSVSGSFYLPTLVILGVYWRIYRAAVQQSRFLESGIKTTKAAVTLRVHRGGDKLTLRAHRGGMGVGMAAGLAAGLATGLGGINGTCLMGAPIPPPPTPAQEKAERKAQKKRVKAHKKAQKSKGIARLMLPMAPLNWHDGRRSFRGQTGDQEGEDGPQDGDSPNNSPERRLAGPPGKVAKFRRQKKAAKTLGIVVGAFLLCWFPFFFILPLDSLCSQCHISETLFATFFWLGYFNSCLNPFIYACTSKDFKRAFERILCRGRGRRRRTLNHAAFHSAVWRRGTTMSSAARTPSPARHGIEGLLANTMPLTDPCGAVWRSPKSPNRSPDPTSAPSFK